jgi:predicted RecB family nuclease
MGNETSDRITPVQITLSPSKVTAWSSCEHYLSLETLRQLDKKGADESVAWLAENDESELPPSGFLEMLRRKGNFHERRCLEAYKAHFGDGVLIVPNPEKSDTWDTWIEKIDELKPFDIDQETGQARYDVIFQMPFKHEGMRGLADFLIKNEKVDSSGKVIGYTYEPVDSKLARSNASKSHLLQLLFYAEALEAKTKLPLPDNVHIALGKAIPRGELPELTSFETTKFWWHWKSKRSAINRVTGLSKAALESRTVPEKCSFCSMCDFVKKCKNRWGKDSLNELAGVMRAHREALSINEREIERIGQLALLPKAFIDPDIRDFDDRTKEDFSKLVPELENKYGNVVDLSQRWEDRDSEESLDGEQLIKLWRQARLQTIRKENALCPDCGNKISEDDTNCPNCAASMFKEVQNEDGDVISLQPRHLQAVAPVFLFNESEIKRKMLDRYEKLSLQEKVYGYKRLQESLLGLNEPSPHDIYLDFEGHPFWRIEEEIIFLFGYIFKNGQNWEYESIWSHDENDMPTKEKEREAAIELVMRLHKMWKTNPQMNIYHYNHTERTLLRDLASDADSLTDAPSVIAKAFKDSQGSHLKIFEELVDNGVFVDLLSVVRNSMQVGYQSMSLKYMEKLAGFKRREYPIEDLEGLGSAISAGAGAVFHYELYSNYELYQQENDPEALRMQREKRKQLIADYNEDDVQATRYLHEWLIKQRESHDELPTNGYVIDIPPPELPNGPAEELINRISHHLAVGEL